MEDNYRILIKNSRGKIYRLFNVGFLKDHFDENYIKFQFPQFKDISLVSGFSKEGERNYMQENFEFDKILPKGVIEYSYHYKKGVGHWKTSAGERLPQQVVSLDSIKAMSIFRLSLYSIDVLKEYNAYKANDKYQLLWPVIFNERAMNFEVTVLLNSNVPVNFDNTDNNSLIPTGFTTIQNNDVIIRMQGYEFQKVLNRHGIEIFQLNDPFSNIKKDNT